MQLANSPKFKPTFSLNRAPDFRFKPVRPRFRQGLTVLFHDGRLTEPWQFSTIAANRVLQPEKTLAPHAIARLTVDCLYGSGGSGGVMGGSSCAYGSGVVSAGSAGSSSLDCRGAACGVPGE
jgi:hypothetical protein